ncbi:MAG: UDP-2,3-diacylglucosamine diphosphatase [Methanobacterium sp.]
MKKKIESLFISDLHLGARSNNAMKALKVLREYEYKNLFLLGDIIDIKALSHNWKWESAENDVWNFIEKFAEKKEVVYCVGNHERGFFDKANIKNFLFFDGYVYKDMLLCHGHKFDENLESNHWPRALINVAYDSCSSFNAKMVSQIKKLIRRTPGYLKNFRKNAVEEAKKFGFKKVVCGHTHQQEHCVIENIEYINIGDFKEDATYAIETIDGNIILEG